MSEFQERLLPLHLNCLGTVGGEVMEPLHQKASGQPISERRHCTRIETALPLGLTVPPSRVEQAVARTTFLAETYDIGMGGVSCSVVIGDSLLAKELAGRKKLLDLNIELNENAEIRGRADVAWIYHLKGLSVQTKYRLGLGFVNLKKAQNDFLSSYLRHLTAKQHQRIAKTRGKIKTVLAQIAKIDEQSFCDETRIREELKVDSLMAMETLAILETIYDIDIDVERVVDVITVGDMMDLIQQYTRHKE